MSWQVIGESNPFENFMRLYELGLRPRGFKSVSELQLKEAPKEPLQAIIFKINRGSYKHYDKDTVAKPVVDCPLTGDDVISPVRFHGGDMTFTTPSNLDRSCLGCYAWGDKEINYTHYWTEDCNDNLRPLNMENVISFFGDAPPDDEIYQTGPPLNYTARRRVGDLELYSSLHSIPLPIFLKSNNPQEKDSKKI
jgi:hypothetical protein